MIPAIRVSGRERGSKPRASGDDPAEPAASATAQV